MARIPTLKVKRGNDTVIINESDFDKKIHKLVAEPVEEAPAAEAPAEEAPQEEAPAEEAPAAEEKPKRRTRRTKKAD